MQRTTFVAAAFALALLAPLGAADRPVAEEEPTQFVVGFDSGRAPPAAGERFAGGHVVVSERALGFAVVRAEGRGFEAQAQRSAGVRYVEADPALALEAYTPNDPRFASQHALPLIGAPAAWDTTRGATSVKVCLADSGARYTHEDIAPRWGGGYDFVNGDADAWDDRGHGTHVTGIAAAAIGNGKGIAGVATATILHAKVLDATGYGTWSNVARGIRWCADQGASAISLSLGGSTGSTALHDAVRYAVAQGAVVVAASGNSGAENGVLYPARYPEAIAVGCVLPTKELCSFSNRGSELDLVAPGSAIDSTYYRGDADYVRMSGTSMSTPHVAGAVALLKAAAPSMGGAGIRDLLERSAEDLGASGADASYGRGLLRVDRAMTLAVGGSAPAPEPAPALPDLQVASLSVSPASPVAGEGATVTARVANAGAGPAGGFSVRFVVDGSVAGTATFQGLAAGATVDVRLSWTPSASGSSIVLAQADASQQVAESDESNNERSLTVTVASPPTASRGVALSAPTTSATVPPGGSVRFAMAVQNTGSAPDTIALAASAGGRGWKVALDAASLELAAGETRTIHLQVTAPKGGAARGATLDALVDAWSASAPAAGDQLRFAVRVG
ncbi:MAG TPA: S8 family serine peptidase [Candidatus Thermoplasmatota archaeon]|nr:S8 family serine peptidase [Candidatus Thermoplasmatota archaeon]